MMRARFTVELEGDYTWRRIGVETCEASLRRKQTNLGDEVQRLLDRYYPLLRVTDVSFADVEYDDTKVQPC